MNESLKELAVRYFEGPIAPEEECELFGFLAASPENAALMREWEREWKQRHVPSADVLRSLARLNGKIVVDRGDAKAGAESRRQQPCSS